MKDKLLGSDEASYPQIMPFEKGLKYDVFNGFSKREYACIHLELPDSGTDWLDELIAKKQQYILSIKVKESLINRCFNGSVLNDEKHIIKLTEFADALIQQLNKK